MLVSILSIICIVLLLVLTFVFLKIRPLYKDLQIHKRKLLLPAGEANPMKSQIDEKLSSGIQNVIDKSDQLKSDPLVSELTDTLKSRLNFFSKMFAKILESSQIILGISAGLFGMSVVAVIFHFIKYVANHHTSELLESVSYSVFFLFVTLGIISNNYLQRKIKREQEKLLKAEVSFKEKLENLKASYETILDKSRKEQHDTIQAKAKILDELSQLANQRQQEIVSLENSSKTDTIFEKSKRRFRRKRKPSAEAENE